ncbi:MAG: multidrug efflux SMR transporter [Mariprofundus sp.]
MSAGMAWIWLGLAIVLEVGGTVCMKLSEGFERWLPAVVMLVLYIASFSALALALKRIELGTAYAIWAGIGTALIALIGIVIFKEAATAMKMVAITLIISGVVLLHLSGD